jgi:hypothetical protein
VGSRSALSNLASIKASTLSDFNRAEAIALVCLGWDKNTSWPVFCANSTIHHHDPIASSAILLPVGSFFKTCSAVITSFAKRNCEGDRLSLNTANCDTYLCKSIPTKCSIAGLLFSCARRFTTAGGAEAIPFIRSTTC